MTLLFSQLSPQLDSLGQEFARQERQYEQLLELALRLLREHATDYRALSQRARMVAEQLQWRGAIPMEEPLDSAHPLPPHPPRASIIAADGSQIEPDRHGAALYYLINIGSIVFEHGTGQRPRAESEPHLFYRPDEVYEDKRLVQGNLLDIRRDTAELAKLAALARLATSAPVLTLTDGTLLLWILEETPASRKQAKLREYLAHLDDLHALKAAVAAFTSRPRYAEVIDLLHLASLGEDLSRQSIESNPLEGLVDRALFRFLAPGERSALFVSANPINADYRRHRESHEICFFYLNVGDEHRPEIARVEIPRWVATMPSPYYQPEPPWQGDYRLIDFAHAAIYEQCRIARGYPYVLGRAHELALVSVGERQELEMRIISAMARYGLEARPSEKARLKELTGTGRRRHKI